MTAIDEHRAGNGATSAETSLEEEIYHLRMTMEHVIAQENSLTSELVIFVSNLLDQKINEYLQLKKKS